RSERCAIRTSGERSFTGWGVQSTIGPVKLTSCASQKRLARAVERPKTIAALTKATLTTARGWIWATSRTCGPKQDHAVNSEARREPAKTSAERSEPLRRPRASWAGVTERP